MLSRTGAAELRQSGALMLTKSKRFILPWLPQDERFVQIFGNSHDFFNSGPPPEFKINVYYENSAGKKQTTVSRISIADFEGVSRVRGTDQESADALKQIAKSIEGWGLGRLKVETITAAEVAREQKKRYDEIMEEGRKKDRDKPAGS
jgi:hypothetical protein